MVGCLEPKSWEARDDGWTERTRQTVELTADHSDAGSLVEVAAFRPYPNLDYRFVGCGDEGFADLDVLVYGDASRLVGRDGSSGRDPEFTLRGDVSQRLSVRLFAAALTEPSGEAGVLVLAK